MKDVRNGIVIAGSLIADVFYEIDTYPKQGMLTNVRGTSRNVGGSGNLILDLAKLDKQLQVEVCAIIGCDENGDYLISELSKYDNINQENITRQGNSSVTIVMNAKDSKQRTFFFQPAASDVFDETHISWQRIRSKIFHLEYLLLLKKVDSFDAEYGTHGARILHDAKKNGMITSIDVVSEQSERAQSVVRAALKYTDICCINESEAEAVTGIPLLVKGRMSREKVLEAVRLMQKMGVAKWIVIHAPECGYGYDCKEEKLVYIPSLQLPEGYIKGSNGAGDAYCSGILYGAHQNKTLEDAMKLARACAACSLSENNGTDGMRPYQDVLLVAEQYN